MEVSVDITDFTAGELSPRMKGRIDYKKYYDGLDTCLNMVPMPQGGATRRPGTLLVALSKQQASKSRLKDFVFSNQQPYILEFSNGNVRIYKNDGVVTNVGAPVDVTVPYQTADLPALKFAQSADTLFIAHPSYPAASLTRSSDTSWTYTVLTFLDGPYLDQNLTTNAVTPSGTTGSITLNWTNTTGINNGAGFTSADIGRYVRVKIYSLWACCLITAITNAHTVTATVQAKVNNGCDAALDGNTWVTATKYDKGTVVANAHGDFFIALQAGLSGTNGPFGQGSAILDGSIIWSSLTALTATQWTQSTVYNVCDIVYTPAQPGYYQAQIPGKSSSGGSGPTGTGSGISDASITWNYLAPFTLPTATTNWALGAWCPQNGYPNTVRFWQQRLFWGGFPAQPNRIFGSQTGDFLNHAPTTSNGTVLDSSALDWLIDDDKVQSITWLIGAGSAQAQQLGMGTAAGEQILQAANTALALTPTSVQAYGETAYGSAANVDPLRIGKAVLFADRTGRKLREWAFYWQQGGYIGPDLLQASEHITRAADGTNQALNGIAQQVYQQAPHQVIWAMRNDGQLVSFTYDRDQQVFAPARHILGGNYYGGPPVVESLAVIPSQDNTYDEVWLIVLRTINNVVTRSVEVMTRYFDGQPQDLAFFVDCGLSSALTFPAATLTPPALANSNASDAAMPPRYAGTGIFTANAAVFAGDVTDKGKIIRVNGGRAVVTAPVSTTQVTAQTLDGAPLLSLAPALQNAWSCDPQHATFSGLTALAGDTVAICGDGADLGTAQVSNAGVVAIPGGETASYATIGYAYSWVMVTMPAEPARAAQAAVNGKVKTVKDMWGRFHETLGVNFGRRVTDPMTDAVTDKFEPIADRSASGAMDQPPALFSGRRRMVPQGGYDGEGQILFYGNAPLPATVLSVIANVEVEEMPVAA